MSEENKSSFEAETKKATNEFKENWNKATTTRENKKVLVGVLGIFFGHIGIQSY